MKILVSNIGSTSFKFRLFDMGEGRSEELASAAPTASAARAAC